MTFRMITLGEAKAEVKRLVKESGMSRKDLEARGDSWELDAEKRGLLEDIRGLEFLIARVDPDWCA